MSVMGLKATYESYEIENARLLELKRKQKIANNRIISKAQMRMVFAFRTVGGFLQHEETKERWFSEICFDALISPSF